MDKINQFSLLGAEPTFFPGGALHTATQAVFPALQGLAIQSLHLDPGGVREPHVHPNAAQMDFVVSGCGRVGIIGPGGERQLLDMKPGDVSFVPHGHLHWIENTGEEPLHFILITNHEEPKTIHLSSMVEGLPSDTIERAYSRSETFAHFNIGTPVGDAAMYTS